MLLLYNLFIRLYNLSIIMAAPFVPKARLWRQGRRDLFEKLEKLDRGKKRLWIHCASLGEFEQGRPLIEALRKQYPGYQVILTFFSPSGYEIRKNYQAADHVFYLPIDTASNARRFTGLVDPAAAFFIKYEFWYHYLNVLKSRKIPVYLVSAIFRPGQAFFKPYGGFFRKMLACYQTLFVQDQRSRELLKDISFQNVIISGDTRFDRVSDIANSVAAIPFLSEFKSGKKLLIAGSTWPDDEKLLAGYITAMPRDMKLVIAPHEIQSHSLKSTFSLFSEGRKTNVEFYSELTPEKAEITDILIIDSIGLLSSLYSYGDIAYIGGGFGRGIHNILEPAAFGLPVFFGPAYKKFREACDLVERREAFPVTTSGELGLLLKELLADPRKLDDLKLKIKEYVESHRGATSRILNSIRL
jgi:3-deoxy-D-manno-octulosonic-acid transferase